MKARKFMEIHKNDKELIAIINGDVALKDKLYNSLKKEIEETFADRNTCLHLKKRFDEVVAAKNIYEGSGMFADWKDREYDTDYAFLELMTKLQK